MTVRFDMAYALGTSLGSLQTFHDLGLMVPYQDAYAPNSIELEAADARVYGHGWATTALRWGFISQTDRDLLKSFCPGRSAIVYIRLRNDNWDWCDCKAVMIWQAENPPVAGTILDFSIKLRILENYGVVTL